jgi:hypothetical protein
MSQVEREMPWRQGKTTLLDVSETVGVGQLIGADGALATKGTAGGGASNRASYIAAASVSAAARIGVYKECVINIPSFGGSAGDPVYLSTNGDYTRSTPVYGDSALLQKVGEIRADGRIDVNLYEHAQDTSTLWADFTPTLTWTTADPASITKTGRYQRLGNYVMFEVTIVSADGNGATALTIDLPVTAKNNSQETAIYAQQLQNATWADPMAYTNQSTSKVNFEAFTTCTDAQAVEFKVTGWYEAASLIITTWAAWTPTLTYTGDAPATPTTTGRYYQDGNVVFLEMTTASADPGGAATALTISNLPVTPADNSSETAVNAQQLNNATWSNPFAQVAQAAGTITFEGFTATADDEAYELKLAVAYEV